MAKRKGPKGKGKGGKGNKGAAPRPTMPNKGPKAK